jgi:ABC-type phosphate/phosphonate transport system substrate-binding protein
MAGPCAAVREGHPDVTEIGPNGHATANARSLKRATRSFGPFHFAGAFHVPEVPSSGRRSRRASRLPATAETWRLAVTDVEGLERLQTEWGGFKAALEAATGETFEFFPVASRTAAAEALRGETVDFVITGPAEYIVINTMTEAAPLIGFGRPDYHCAIVVRADSGIDEMADLKGKTVAFGDIGSTSNMLCPMQLMAATGSTR